MEHLVRDMVKSHSALAERVARTETMVDHIAHRQASHEAATLRAGEKIEGVDRKLDEVTALINQARGAGFLASKLSGITRGAWALIVVAAAVAWSLWDKAGFRFGP